MDTRLSISNPNALRDPSDVEGNAAFLKSKPTCLQDMPIDILDHIISLLSAQSIPNLMVNRALRPICEQNLYRNIHVPSSERTLHLCRTFVLRPDLALLVRDLDIVLSWSDVSNWRRNRERILPRFSREGEGIDFTPVQVLALAKNVRSFCAAGPGSWVIDSDMTTLRDLVFGMRLTRLEINSFPAIRHRDPRYDGYIMSNFRAVLQAQPLLEVLELPNSSPAVAGWMEQPDLHSTPATSPSSETPSHPKITCSDVPNLRSLVAIPCVAASFLTIAPKLESLSISPWDDQMSSLLLHAGKHGHQIRNLSFEFTWREFMDWDGIEKVLRCFPNVETLAVVTRWEKQYKDEESGKDFLGQASHKIHLLPLLRKLEVYYETNYETEVPIDLEIPGERLMALKTSCSLLEYVIDPLGRIWAYAAMTDRESYVGKPRFA